ncbi:MAG: hypothetical protein K6F77_09215 [Lachnospiraceae bacterium]|nr:hypothetical protein [Lachnospiraceae bacterium]
MDIKKIYKEFADIDIGDLSNNQKDTIYNELSSAVPSDLESIDDHRMFIEVLKKLRLSNIRDMERVGEKFLDTIKSLLSVGEDGVYSNGHRFIYELIQNVDDCDYENIEDCKLEIQFKYNAEPGEIILTYNEMGFKPENVFAITGIAEKSKNLTSDKVEIGEKGIGFKSVFGIADKVHIESGKFSFELGRESFTVPVPKYDDFSPVVGTKMTLKMPAMNVREVYRKLISKYKEKDDVLNQNPILFLNKLTHLRLFVDKNNKYIDFDVQRKIPNKVGKIEFEDNVIVSVEMKDYINGQDKFYNNKIECVRYTLPIVYGEKECLSRYGNEVSFKEKRHKLIALFPISINGMKNMKELRDFKGVMYSFLPTQIHLSIPMAIHIPFKLDSSREFVDPQKENQWFKYTCSSVSVFLKNVFLHFATIMKQSIIAYIPEKNKCFFESTNEKINCLQKDIFKGEIICSEKVFYTTDGTFENGENIVSFAVNEKITNQEKVYKLLKIEDKLFVPSYPFNMSRFGVELIINVPDSLFKVGMQDDTHFSEIIKELDHLMGIKEISYKSIVKNCCPLILTKNHLEIISRNKKLYNGFYDYSKECINQRCTPGIVFQSSISKVETDFSKKICESVQSANIDKNFKDFLNSVSYTFYEMNNCSDDFVLVGEKGILLSQNAKMGSFGKLISEYDKNGVFAATLKIRQASEDLNNADKSLSNEEYLSLLISVRNCLKDAFGNEVYGNYIDLINKAGTDKNRFLNELLQNADDCEYSMTTEPSFSLTISKNIITVKYNEDGFKKENVRAITAIGESTKKVLLEGKYQSIGEKGVGFKSVFGVAKSVEIHSNGFDFMLKDDTPTIPDKCSKLEKEDEFGTTLIFQMKEDVRSILKIERLMELCNCLRKLKNININGNKISIQDTENERVMIINGKKLKFEKYCHEFKITDEDAKEERSNKQRIFSDNQVINYYIPKGKENDSYPLYVGLPTSVKSNIPLIIDAPFELNTSRDNVLYHKWNAYVLTNLYSGILEIMKSQKEKLRINVFKYVKYDIYNQSYNNIIFSDNNLNNFDFNDFGLKDFDWVSELSSIDILPILNDDEEFINTEDYDCVIVPDIIAEISEQYDITDIYDQKIIDTYKKSKYNGLLELLGCEISEINEEIECIANCVSDLIINNSFRNNLYSYLIKIDTQLRIEKENLYDEIKELEIFPIRTKKGVEFVPFSDEIYIHDTKKSEGDILILDTNILKYEDAMRILGNNVIINKLSQEIFDAKYRNQVIDYILYSDNSNEIIANFLLNEYKTNYNNICKIKNELRGILSDIPLEVESGEFKRENKFISNDDYVFQGKLIKEIVVSKDFYDLAEFLGCERLTDIHYDDIDIDIESVSDEDIEEFLNCFSYGYEIIRELIDDEIITDEQVKKYNLEGFIDVDSYGDNEEFPGKAVVDIWRLHNQLLKDFNNNKNPYVEKTKTVFVPQHSVENEKEEYLNSMYGSEYNHKKCFCQICEKSFSTRYIERNDIRKKPKYGMKQMYLSLCLICSKDYILLRNNDHVYKEFIQNIKEAEIGEEETVYVSIGDIEVRFTGVHLAEIQRLLLFEESEI